MIPTSLEVLGVLGLLLGSPAQPLQPELHDHASLLSAAKQLESARPTHVHLFTLGQSRAGREIFGLRISAGQEIPEAQPAILLVAGLDGARAYTSSLALDHATQLAETYGRDDATTALLDSTTIYIVPRVDVDAAEARFLSPLAEVSATGLGVDNDRDGRMGEDGASDVNGDGFITVMRQLDPEGTWIADPTDERALIEAKRAKGERGIWKLYTEGLDSDGDDRVAEDGPSDAVVNRNFQRNWTEHDPSAGRYPTHEPGTLALTQFFLDHKDVALVVTYGEEANLVKKPDSQDDSGASAGSVKTGVYKSDLEAYEELGERYRDLTSNKTEGLGEQPGSFQAFAYHHRGLLCLDIDPWSVPLDAKVAEEESADESAADEGESEEEEKPKEKAPEPGNDAKRLIWLDQNSEGAFLDWTAFDHPQLGAVEIGGFRPYVKVEPPAELLEELTSRHLEFLQSLGAYLPRLELIEVEGRSLGGGLIEIEAVLENDALLPQITRAAERCRAIRPARVTLELPEGATLLGGRLQTLVTDLQGSGGRREFRWLVSRADDSSTIRINVSTDNAGTASATVEVN